MIIQNKARYNLNHFVSTSCILTGILLFIYVTLRAYRIPITHDEALSWNHFVPYHVMEIISYNTDSNGMPNNHILNTLLMKLFCWIFGPNDFTIRIPNLLGYLIYLIYSYKTIKFLRSPVLQITGFLLLNLNLYLLEFFGIGRGYGLANGLLLASIYYFLCWQAMRNNKYLWQTLILCSLAVLSNFSLFQYYLSLIFVINYTFITSNYNSSGTTFKGLIRKNNIPIINTIILFIILFEPFRKILQWHETYGGKDGFWADTVKGIVGVFCYNQSYGNFLFAILNVFAIIAVLFVLFTMIKNLYNKVFSAKSIVFSLLLFLPALAHILDHQLLEIEFLVPRAGQYFYVLFILAFVFALDCWCHKIVNLVNATLTIAASIHFIIAMNTNVSIEWPYDAGNKSLMSYLDSIHQNEKNKKINVGITWIFEPGLNFYRETGKREWLTKFTREGVQEKEYDIYYVLSNDTSLLKEKEKVVLRKFPLSDSYIMK